MSRPQGFPLLPGTVFSDVRKSRYPKPNFFQRENGITMLIDKDPEEDDQVSSLYPPNVGPLVPPWIVYDKKVLSFDAYFKETLQEVYRAPYQVRKVKIFYYLEDGTMQVTEPRVDNAGIRQGCIVSRQRIPRPRPCQAEFLTILDLNVNQTVRIFDRVYQITGCDQFTRRFLNRAGIPVPDPIETPADPGLELRKKTAAITQPRKPSVYVDKLGKFLQNDRKVLQFNAYWDDREAMFGDLRELVVYYFLADDTIQIREIFPKNSGRDAPSTFLKRSKLPKHWEGLPLLGQETDNTILNVLGSGLLGGRYVTDCLDVGAKEIDYITERDLTIGSTINILGREIMLTDCDPFTKEYYRLKYGIEDFTPIPMPVDSAKCAEAQPERILPAFNGWGTHEDTEGNCKTVEPKPPHADFKKFMAYDQIVLRFGAKMISNIKTNDERIFIITYYKSDDTLSVYEMATRNSGFLPGYFYTRRRFYLPNQEWFSSERPKQYYAHHFYVGAVVILVDFTFHLISADEFTYYFMAKNSFEFPKANVDTILAKIQDKIRPQYKEFVAKYLEKVNNLEHKGQLISVMCFEVFRDALIELLGEDITEHEIITLARHLSAEHKSENICDREIVRSTVHWELNRNLWDGMDRLKEHFYHVDPTDSGWISEQKLWTTIKACRLPLKNILIENMFKVLKKNENSEIEVIDFCRFIDRMKIKSASMPPINLYRDVCPNIPFNEAGRLIDWNCFITKLGFEEELKREKE